MYWRQGSAPADRSEARRWLAADLADLVDISGTTTAGRGAVVGKGGASFDDDLRRLRRRVLRRWALGVAARYALLALAIALVPAALAALGQVAWAWALVVPLAVFLVALGLRLYRPPSLERVARLFDDRLGLFDVVATALQVERSGERTDAGPAALVLADASGVLRAGTDGWRVRARLGWRQLGAGGFLVAALAVLAVLGTGSSSPAGHAKVSALAPAGKAGHKGSRMTNVSPPLVPPRAKRAGAKKGGAGEEHRSPLGLYDFGFEGKRPLPKVSGNGRSGLYSRGAPKSGSGPRAFSAQSPGEGNEAREKAEEEADAGSGAKEPAAGEKGRGSEAPESLKSLTGGKAPAAGSVSPVPSKSPSAGAQASTKASGGAGAGGSGGEHSPAGGAGSPRGGRPSGSATAGHGRAALAAGERGQEGATASGALPLRAGFAASRSGKAAGGRGPRNAQGGGGPGRSAGIAGSAFEESAAGSLGYVPPDAGVAAGLDPGLFSRYFRALSVIGGRRW